MLPNKNKKKSKSPRPDDDKNTANTNSELEELIEKLQLNNEALKKIARYFAEKNSK